MAQNHNYKSKTGKSFSHKSWLDDHHSIKSKLRWELLKKLPIEPGGRILDVGCGTGNWTFLLADITGHKGSVIGIDIDQESISAANEKLEKYHTNESVSFFCRHPIEFITDKKFDSIVIFNTLSYINEPEIIIEYLKQFLAEGGRIYIKDSDASSDYFWPIDMQLYCTLIKNVNGEVMENDGHMYDPFFARKIPKLLHKTGFNNFTFVTQSFSFSYPFSAKEESYIRANAKIISDIARQVGHIEESIKWEQRFTKNTEDSIFTNPEFIYATTEFVFYARAPVSS